MYIGIGIIQIYQYHTNISVSVSVRYGGFWGYPYRFEYSPNQYRYIGSVAQVAAKVPKESGRTKLVKNVNKLSVAMLANKFHFTFQYFGKKDDKQSDTGKIIII